MAGQIYELMPKIAKAIGAIGKDMKNQQQGWKFRGIDQIYDAAHGPLCSNGVFVTTEVVAINRDERASKSGGTLLYTCVTLKVSWHASDGSSVSTTVIGEGMDSGDKSSPKAMSEALKYAYFQTFTIPLSDVADPDAETHEVAAKPESKVAVKPKPEPIPPDRLQFNQWVDEYVKTNKLTAEQVRVAVHQSNGNYADARTQLQMKLNEIPEVAC